MGIVRRGYVGQACKLWLGMLSLGLLIAQAVSARQLQARVDHLRARQAPSQADSGPSSGAALPGAVEGRAYYLLADNVTCWANTPDRPYLKSWKNKLTFSQGKVQPDLADSAQ